MMGRRATVGLALLCALLFSAFTAANAAAVKYHGTTLFTCAKSATKTGDFTDEHCDTKGVAGASEFEHKAIVNGTQVVLSNKGTGVSVSNAVLKGEVALTKSEITCTVVETKAPAAGEAEYTGSEKEEEMEKEKTIRHKWVISKSTTLYKTCTVNKPLNCKVKEPIEVTATAEGVENLGATKDEMGVLVKPTGEHFTTITFEGESCVLKGVKANVDGTAVATGTPGSGKEVENGGATLNFTAAMTKETLKFGGNAAEYINVLTARMSGAGGNPISATTVTKTP